MFYAYDMHRFKIVLFLLTILHCVCAKADMTRRVAREIKGNWISIACELRFEEVWEESKIKIKSTWLKRELFFNGRDAFEGRTMIYDDFLCQRPLLEFNFRGRIEWKGPHDVAVSAQKVDYIMDEEYTITPRASASVKKLNKLSPGACGDRRWELDTPQSILKKPCVLLGTQQGEVIKEFDLIYISPGGMLLFMGAKPVSSQRLSREELRPKGGLELPLARKHLMNWK